MKQLYTLILLVLLFIGCDKANEPSEAGDEQNQSAQKVALGAQLFHDNNLSNTRHISCATCHDPEHGYADARSNAIGGALSLGDDNTSYGGRNAPTASYAQFSPPFSKLEDGNYSGGQFHDGRAATLADQAKGPFLDTAEMQMPSREAVVARLQENSSYVQRMKALYGEEIFSNSDAAYDAIANAIEAYEKTALFAPFDSKYDRFIACKQSGKGEGECYSEGNWSIDEQAGYALFFSNNNLNCVKCHSHNSKSEAQAHELFTNYRYENIGTPKNFSAMDAKGLLHEINDLGLGGRADINSSAEYGKIKVPTLRNIAVTAPYMHNGVFASLETVIAFYDHQGVGKRALNPQTNQTWEQPDVNATINRALLEQTKEITDAKIRQLIAFLKTLTDQKYEHLLQ